MSTNTDKHPIERETKVMLLIALSRGFFEDADFEFLARKYENIRFDNEKLHGSIPIHDWILWRTKENNKNDEVTINA